MAQPAQIVLYSLFVSDHIATQFFIHPSVLYQTSQYVHRVRLALEQAEVEYTTYDVNILEKPDWYLQKVNPEGKVRALKFRVLPEPSHVFVPQVPSLLYGGPKCTPENPSPESTVVTESLVILEFLADVYPDARILPMDPSGRAAVRGFIAHFEEKFVKPFQDAFLRGYSTQPLLDAFAAVQVRLSATGFACGEWSMADMAVVPFFVRVFAMLENDIGKYPEGEGKKAFATLTGDAKFARIAKYVEDIKTHPAVKATWNEVSVFYPFGRMQLTNSHDDQEAQLSASRQWPGLLRGHPYFFLSP